MKPKTLFFAMMVAAAFAGNAEAIYKCTTAKGVVYQDRPCREGTEADVQIVIPTGELAPKAISLQEDAGRASDAAMDSRSGAARAGRSSGGDAGSAGAPGNRKTASAANGGTAGKPSAAAKGAEDSRRNDARAPAEAQGVPMTAEQARNTEPSAKYYTIDGAWPKAEIPQQMNCESPSGEKRQFLLSNGKLSSI